MGANTFNIKIDMQNSSEKNPSSWPSVILRENTSARSVREAGMVALLERIPDTRVSVEQVADAIRAHGVTALPVGSVEFVRQAMLALGLVEPVFPSYPNSLREQMLRDVGTSTAGAVLAGKHGRVFCKPIQAKVFNGFVFDPQAASDQLDYHDQEQVSNLSSISPETPVLISQPVEFLAEWRCYVHLGKVIGIARYDHLEDEGVPEPAMEWVEMLIERFQTQMQVHGYAIDVGLLSNGDMCVVEVNDGWALGFYPNSMSTREYIKLLWSRWQQMAKEHQPPTRDCL